MPADDIIAVNLASYRSFQKGARAHLQRLGVRYVEAVDIIQPDTTKCGGLSEARRIVWMAHDHNVLLVSHGWNTALGLAADLHRTPKQSILVAG